MEWYVLQALTGREQDARAALERAGFDARVPTELRPIHRRGQWIEQEYTLLPGYVFVGMDFEPRLYRAIKEVPGAVRLWGCLTNIPRRCRRMRRHCGAYVVPLLLSCQAS